MGYIFIILIIIIIFIILFVKYKKTSKLLELKAIFKEISFTQDELLLILELIDIKRLENYYQIKNHKIFEEAIDIYIKKIYKGVCADSIDDRIRLIYSIRKKFGFFNLSPYVSLKSTRNITRGSKIVLKIIDKNLDMLVSVDSELCLGLIPMSKTDLSKLDIVIGQKISCSYFRLQDGQYYFTTKVKRIREDNTLFLEHTTNIERKQFRQYVRLNITIPIKFFSNETNMEFKDATILNISAGGAMLVTNEKVSEGTNIVFDLKLAKHINIKGVMGKVLECSLKDNGRYKVRLKFESLQEEYRDIITKFILKYQSENKAKFL